MKFTDIPSLGLSPGGLTVWRACATPMSDTTWAADLRRASHVQEAHITYALKAAGEGPLPPSWLGCAFDLPAELDADAFATALRGWTNRHEALRSQLTLSPRCTPGGRLQRMTLPAGAMSIHPSAARDFTDGRKLARYLELFDSETGPLGWPGYICATISRPEATTACLAADHTLTDGYSVLLTAYEIHTLYAAALAAANGKPAPPPLPPTASYLDFAEAERTAADALTAAHESIVHWRQFLTEAGGRLPEFPVPGSDVSGSPAAQPGGYTELVDASTAHAFDRVCRAAGGASFSGLLACLAKVGHEITGSGEFRTMAPFHTRTGPSRSSIGWYVGMGPIAFPLSATDSFAGAARSAVSGLDGVKDLVQIPTPRVEELLGRPLRDPFMFRTVTFVAPPVPATGTLGGLSSSAAAAPTRTTCTSGSCVPTTASSSTTVTLRPARQASRSPHYMASIKHLLASIASTARWPATAHPTGDYCP